MRPTRADAELERARDAGTPAEALRRLASHSDRRVKAAVAANPNVPPDVLWALAGSFPKQVLNNPSFELLPLEDPQWLRRPGPGVVHGLMSQERAPAWFLEQVFSGPLPLRRHIAERTKSPDVLWRLVRGAHASEQELLETVAENSHLTPSLREHLMVEHDMVRTVDSPSRQPAYFIEAAFAAGLLEDPSGQSMVDFVGRLPVGQLERFALSTDVRMRLAVASAPSVPPGLLVRLARDPNPLVRDEVARNARCPCSLARRLRQVESQRPRPLPQNP